MEVRLARAEDLRVLADLVLGFRDHLGAAEPGPDALAARLPGVLADPATEFGLAWSDEPTPLGYSNARFFTSVWASGPEVHLEDLYVVPDARGHGVGAALLAFVIERAKLRGAVALGLHTNENNERAQAFYRRAGLEPRTEARWDGGREVYWGLRL